MPSVDLRAYIRDIPDFPTPGIVFKDITPLLLDPEALDAAVLRPRPARRRRPGRFRASPPRHAGSSSAGRSRASSERASSRPASRASCPPRRSAPSTSSNTGSMSLEVHADAFAGGARVLVHDDLLATGGTASALCELVGEPRRRGRRVRVPGRAELPRRPRAAGAARGPRFDRLFQLRWQAPRDPASSRPASRSSGT